MLRYFFLSFTLLANLIYGQQTSLKVAIAASLQKPFEEISAAFEHKTNLKVDLVSGSSGMLATQIRNKAPFDIFVSANQDFSNTLLKENIVTRAKPFCKGALVWWSKLKVSPEEIQDAATQGIITTIAIANPQLAPYGMAALEWLTQKVDVKKYKLVYGENIGTVNRYIYSLSVDAAITSLSSMYAGELKDTGNWYPLTTAADDQLVNVIAVVKESEASESFIEFVLGTESKEILKNYGYISIK